MTSQIPIQTPLETKTTVQPAPAPTLPNTIYTVSIIQRPDEKYPNNQHPTGPGTLIYDLTGWIIVYGIHKYYVDINDANAEAQRQAQTFGQVVEDVVLNADQKIFRVEAEIDGVHRVIWCKVDAVERGS